MFKGRSECAPLTAEGRHSPGAGTTLRARPTRLLGERLEAGEGGRGEVGRENGFIPAVVITAVSFPAGPVGPGQAQAQL